MPEPPSRQSPLLVLRGQQEECDRDGWRCPPFAAAPATSLLRQNYVEPRGRPSARSEGSSTWCCLSCSRRISCVHRNHGAGDAFCFLAQKVFDRVRHVFYTGQTAKGTAARDAEAQSHTPTGDDDVTHDAAPP